jgi:hypothetical protein
MKIIDQVKLYVNICDEINVFSKKEIKELLGLKRLKINESKQTIEEYLTLLILFKYSSMNCIKGFWYREKYFSNNAWPNMPSYARFIIWINRLELIIKDILEKHWVKLNQQLGFIDSTKLVTTSNYWFGKVHKEARKGYSSTGDFRGFKLHALINTKKSLINYKITPGNVHDLTPVKEGLLDGQIGKILGDSGYISYEEYHKLMGKNILFIAKPRKNTIENELLYGYKSDLNTNYLCSPWDKLKNLYTKRVSIERYFSYVKEHLNLKLNKLHSSKSLFTQVYSALLAFQWEASNRINIA